MKNHKRCLKNVIMVVVIVLMCALTFGAMYSLKSNNSASETQSNMSEMPSSSSEMGGNGGGMPSQNGSQTPPEKPGESSDNSNSNSSDSSGTPELPADSSTSQNNSTPPSDNSSSSNSSSESSNGAPSEMPGGNAPDGGMPNENGTTSSIGAGYYACFIVSGAVIAGLILYLIMSNFNKKKFKETFVNADKIVIYVLATCLVTGAITYADVKLADKYFLATSTNTSENGNQNNTQNGSATYSASKEITSDENITSGSYTSSTADENAISASGDIDVTLDGITVTKTGDSDGGDNTSFYGTNSAILAKDGANVTITDAEITTDATGANGVFSYGGSATTSNSSSDGTTVNISNSKITTTKDNSGGIMTTGGGVMNATNLEVNTAGTSSAAIRTDRGGGTVTVKGGTYTTTGQGSPAVYSTADVTVSSAKLVSKASEGIVIEGKNSVTIEDVTLTDSNTKLNGQSTTYKNIFLYQSMSGDADTGTAEFTAKDSTITTNNGDTLYVTNTTATINLENNKIVNNDEDGNFLRIQKDSWGTSGSNGGTVTLNMTNQDAEGSIVVDEISTLTMNMTSASYFEGVINADNTAKSITLKLDKTSKIKLTGNSYITSLEDADEDYSNIDFNGYKLYVNGKAIN